MLTHEAYVWMKEVTSSNSCAFGASCRRGFEKGLFCFLWNRPKSVMHVQSILWFDRLATSTPCVIPSTPSHWLICSRRRSFFIRANHMTYARTSMSSLMVPHLNSVVFYYKTTTWSCLSGTACSHDGGSPVIWKFWWVVVEPISSILSPPWFMLNINLVLETL